MADRDAECHRSGAEDRPTVPGNVVRFFLWCQLGLDLMPGGDTVPAQYCGEQQSSVLSDSLGAEDRDDTCLADRVADLGDGRIEFVLAVVGYGQRP